jgi:hypothetical protein
VSGFPAAAFTHTSTGATAAMAIGDGRRSGSLPLASFLPVDLASGE